MKKLFAMLLTVVMLLSLAAPTFAATEKGSITINNVSTDAIYSVFRLLDLESYNATSDSYSYKSNSDWSGFFGTADALEYVAVEGDGYVTWIAGEDDADTAAFAKLALAYAEDNDIAPVQSSSTEGKFVISTDPETQVISGKFSDLDLGYYLVDSTVGTLCGLTTTNPDASIYAKNGIPTIEKEVQEDSTQAWGNLNTADIGQTVYFRATITAQAGAENYVLHDVLSAGLTFDRVSKVERITDDADTPTAVAATNYTVWTAAGITEDAGDDVSDGCSFEVRFTEGFCNGLEAEDQIVVYYQATLNETAVIASDGNPNEVWLAYGEGRTTAHDTTVTYTYAFDIVKTDAQDVLLDGAQFKIYDAATGGAEVAVALMEDGVTYRRAKSGEAGVPIVVKDGKVRIIGFDSDTYYLEETVAPVGYNKLTARQAFTISDSNLDSIFDGDVYTPDSGIQVVNKTGSALPETGGFGTILFITIGGFVMLTTGVFLFAKKRMSQIAE